VFNLQEADQGRQGWSVSNHEETSQAEASQKIQGDVSLMDIPIPPINIPIPIPATLLQTTWFLIGIMFGRAFKGIDEQTQKSTWFTARSPLTKFVLKRALDFLHHFWIGLLLVVYATQPELIWFGWGMVIDDTPDIPRRIKKVLVR
jgi:hypothetical protein